VRLSGPVRMRMRMEKEIHAGILPRRQELARDRGDSVLSIGGGRPMG